MDNRRKVLFLFCTVFLIFFAISSINATDVNDTTSSTIMNSDKDINLYGESNTNTEVKNKAEFKNTEKSQNTNKINKNNSVNQDKKQIISNKNDENKLVNNDKKVEMKENKLVNSNQNFNKSENRLTNENKKVEVKENKKNMLVSSDNYNDNLNNLKQNYSTNKSIKTASNTTAKATVNDIEVAYFFIHENGELQENITEIGNTTSFSPLDYIPRTDKGSASFEWKGSVNITAIKKDWNISSSITYWTIDTQGQTAFNKYIVNVPTALKTFLTVNNTTQFVNEAQAKQILKNFYPDMYNKYFNSSYNIVETQYIYFPYSIKREKMDNLIHVDGVIIPYYVFELIPDHDKDPINNVTKKPSVTNATVINNIYKNSKLNITVKDAKNGTVISNGTVLVSLPNGTEVMGITDSNGNVIIPVDLPVGEYKLPVTYMGNENYTISNTTVTINIQKIRTNIKIEATNTKINTTNTIKITLTDKNKQGIVGENVTVIIDNNQYNLTTKENGVITYTTYSSSIGRNNVLVSAIYGGNEIIGYDSSSSTTTFNVRKLDTNITVNQITNPTIGSNITVSGTLKDEDGKAVSNVPITLLFSKDNTNKTIYTNSDGKYNFKYEAIILGSNEITILYNGNDALNPNNTGTIFNVRKINTQLTVNPIENTTMGSQVLINGILKDEFGNIIPNANITLEIDGNLYKLTTDLEGKYEYSYYANQEKDVIVNLIYAGNTTYNSNTVNTIFNVRKINTTITINPVPTVKEGSDVEISGYLSDEFGNKLVNTTVRITIAQNTFNVTTDANGMYYSTIKANSSMAGSILVLYVGNKTYKPSTNTTDYNVDKIHTKISINKLSQTVIGNTVEIGGILKDEFDNLMPNTKIKLSINGKEVVLITDDKGVYSYNYIANTTDSLIVLVTYEGDSTYYPSNNQTSGLVRKIITTLTINPIVDVNPRENITISGNLKDEFERPLSNTDVTVIINGEIVGKVTTDNNGYYTLNRTASVVGIRNIIVVYDGNNTHYQTSNQTSLNVKVINTTISINHIEDVTVGSSIVVNGTLKDQFGNRLASAEILVIAGEHRFIVYTDKDGNYNITLTTHVLGLRTILVQYVGNSTYNPSNNQTTVYTHPIKTNTTVETNVNTIKYGQGILINGTLKDEFGNIMPNATVMVTVGDGELYKVLTDTNGKFNVTHKTHVIGVRKVIAEFVGNTTYSPSSNETYFIVETIDTKIHINKINDTKIGSPVLITGTVYDEFDNLLPHTEIRFSIAGKVEYGFTDDNGNFKYMYVPIKLGSNTIIYGHLGNSTHNPSTNNTFFYVYKINTQLTLNSKNNYVGSTVVVNGTLKDEYGNKLANQNITLDINGQIVKVTTDDSGNYNTTFIPTESETILIKAIFNGVTNYNPTGNQTIINITKINTTVMLNEVANATFGNDTLIIGTLHDEFGNPLIGENLNLIINGIPRNITTGVDGFFSYIHKTDLINSNEVIVLYYGDNKYMMSGNRTYFNVDDIKTSISINEVENTTMMAPIIINGTLKDEFGNILPNTKVVILVNNQTMSVVTDVNGNYKYEFNASTLGKNSISVLYAGNVTHEKSLNKTSFNVRKINSFIDVNKVPLTIIGDDATINGTLYDEFGKAITNATVTISINDELIDVTTDSNGNYKYTFKTNKTEVNVVKVMYDGNDAYLSTNSLTSFNVRKISTLVTINNITNAKIGFNVTINGTLYDEFGNVMKNNTIEIIVNHVKYNVTTDDEGNYKYVYTVNSLDIHNISVHYNGSSIHSISNNKTDFNVSKVKTIIAVSPVKGTIGEKTTLITQVTDEFGNLINGGNIVFKLNGKTLRVDGSFNSTKDPLKLTVKNGIVTYDLLLDAYLRNVKNITTSYSGTYSYDDAKSNTEEVIIEKRTAQITVTTTPVYAKQNTNITFTAEIIDITENIRNKTLVNDKGRVVFILNNKTLKDENGDIVILNVVNNTAKYTYTIPSGTTSVDNDYILRNHTVKAVYSNKLFNNAYNTTAYHVELSNITIDIKNVTVSTVNKKMSINANILDYQGNNVNGTNKICLKVNGATLKDENNNTIYYNVFNGVIDLNDIDVSDDNIKNVTIVTGNRQAYESGRNTTDIISIVD